MEITNAAVAIAKDSNASAHKWFTLSQYDSWQDFLAAVEDYCDGALILLDHVNLPIAWVDIHDNQLDPGIWDVLHHRLCYDIVEYCEDYGDYSCREAINLFDQHYKGEPLHLFAERMQKDDRPPEPYLL